MVDGLCAQAMMAVECASARAQWPELSSEFDTPQRQLPADAVFLFVLYLSQPTSWAVSFAIVQARTRKSIGPTGEPLATR